MSLNQYDATGTIATFTGLSNYAEAITDPHLTHSLGVTFLFTGTALTITVLMGLGVAILLNEEFRGRGIVRVLCLLPWAIPEFMGGILWSFVYSHSIGTLNGLLVTIGIIDKYMSWLVPDRAIYLVSIAWSWHFMPLAAFFFLGALQTVPQDLYNQAKVDGAKAFTRFRVVTFPHLKYSLLIVLVLASVEALRAWDIFFTMTMGGPVDSTQTMTYLIYREVFRSLNFGLGNAFSWILVVVTLAITIIYFIILTRKR
ncbi:MAG: ABC transporter permease subunit [Nitrososphaeria archaeon]|nr:ABC transporter permease subunit [Nitrososphaeria archaeon]